MAVEIINTQYKGIPCRIVHQGDLPRSETVFYLNPEGVNLAQWPMAHKTMHGLSADEWRRIKTQVPKQLEQQP